MNKTEAVLDRADFCAAFVRILGENGLAHFATPENTEKFFLLTERLLAANAVMNLTAVTDPHEIILKHYADSLTAAKYIKNGARVIDVGCGAGFPSLPLAIARPDLKITAIDSTAKRIVFVRDCAAALALHNLTAEACRAEDTAAGKLRGKYDCATARAVARLNILCELCIPFLRVGGVFLPMKAKSGAEELIEAKNAVASLRAEVRFSDVFTLADTKSGEEPQHRMIAGIEKVGETEKIYPRSFAQIKKKPL